MGESVVLRREGGVSGVIGEILSGYIDYMMSNWIAVLTSGGLETLLVL
jgi:hypothetical protein